ncbi:hypothetical protein N2152v2_002221, partial [Parachlorella kessleri]
DDHSDAAAYQQQPLEACETYLGAVVLLPNPIPPVAAPSVVQLGFLDEVAAGMDAPISKWRPEPDSSDDELPSRRTLPEPEATCEAEEPAEPEQQALPPDEAVAASAACPSAKPKRRRKRRRKGHGGTPDGNLAGGDQRTVCHTADSKQASDPWDLSAVDPSKHGQSRQRERQRLRCALWRDQAAERRAEQEERASLQHRRDQLLLQQRLRELDQEVKEEVDCLAAYPPTPTKDPADQSPLPPRQVQLGEFGQPQMPPFWQQAPM